MAGAGTRRISAKGDGRQIGVHGARALTPRGALPEGADSIQPCARRSSSAPSGGVGVMGTGRGVGQVVRGCGDQAWCGPGRGGHGDQARCGWVMGVVGTECGVGRMGSALGVRGPGRVQGPGPGTGWELGAGLSGRVSGAYVR